MADSVWYVTTDEKASETADASPTTLYILKYEGGVFSTIYTEESNYAQRWIEPPIATANRDTINVIALQRFRVSAFPDYGNYVPQVLVFDDETLVSNTILDPSPGEFYWPEIDKGQWALVDSEGFIHILALVSYGGQYELYDYISDDNGVTWTPSLVLTQASYNASPSYILESSNGDIYIVGPLGQIYKSSNSGGSWSFIGTLDATYYYAGLVNNAFFVDKVSGTDVFIYAGADIASLGSPILTFSGEGAYYRGANFAFDGTYWYLAFAYRNHAINRLDVDIYRSSSYLTGWTKLASFSSLVQVPVYNTYNQLLVSEDGTLFYNVYYGETDADHHWMTFWSSTDQGENWSAIQTPFWDANNGTDPEVEGAIAWYSCPQAILLRVAADETPPEEPIWSTTGCLFMFVAVPSPCTVCVRRTYADLYCLTRVPYEVACIDAVPEPPLCLTRIC